MIEGFMDILWDVVVIIIIIGLVIPAVGLLSYMLWSLVLQKLVQ